MAHRKYKTHELKTLLTVIKVYEKMKKEDTLSLYGQALLKEIKKEIDIRMKEYSDKQKSSKLKQILATDHPYTIIPTGLTELDVQQWTSWTTS